MIDNLKILPSTQKKFKQIWASRNMKKSLKIKQIFFN